MNMVAVILQYLNGVNSMKSSYKEDDITLLLKDITGLVKPIPSSEREVLIQNGIHYCEMLPLEYQPSQKYLDAYNAALENYSEATAKAVCSVSEKIYSEKGKNIVLVSLARAGLPIGILIKHYLEKKYDIKVYHYGISIIRGRGIDDNAMKYILKRHNQNAIQFVDGWIGKGAITSQLKEALINYPGVSSELAVLSDPANITDLCGTHEDILIPSSCLNCTVSGLVSRTFLRSDLIKNKDFHGAAYYTEFEGESDLSYKFIERIEENFDYTESVNSIQKGTPGIDEVKRIATDFNIDDINLIKPGIGEATRVLLRRVPWKILINKNYKNDSSLSHLLRLAEEKNVEIEYYDLNNYKACGIIKNLADA